MIIQDVRYDANDPLLQTDDSEFLLFFTICSEIMGSKECQSVECNVSHVMIFDQNKECNPTMYHTQFVAF